MPAENEPPAEMRVRNQLRKNGGQGQVWQKQEEWICSKIMEGFETKATICIQPKLNHHLYLIRINYHFFDQGFPHLKLFDLFSCELIFFYFILFFLYAHTLFDKLFVFKFHLIPTKG